ncbi:MULTISPECIES: hypothetical protein [unclassified Paenarthrobacter]|uniref:hypothetical protein n=1 Tax=unclassified Paenarthrobacter TaxID=2634190 RepID=UPI0038117027
MRRTPRKAKGTQKPVFGAFVLSQTNRCDIVGDLAREAQKSHFEGSTISDMWDHLERLNIMDECTDAMTQAEQEYNLLVLDWEVGRRASVRVRSIVSGGLPSQGRRR